MRIVVIGEGMVELSRRGAAWSVGYGGDTLNMAVHLARLGDDVAFATALGRDPFSDDLRAAWAGEGLDTGLILTDPARQPGLYAIRTDPQGERSFSYWRSDSAARGLFTLAGADAVMEAAEQADLLCYSLITLAILPPSAREALFSVCRHVRRRGGRVAFDGNFRPLLWSSREEARSARDAAIACADIGLPTLDDERALAHAPDAAFDAPTDAAIVAAQWRARGTAETIVKLGPDGCRLPDGRIVAPPARLDPIDTSGAGDAFDAGYLHARLAGATIAEAALAGHRLAGWVIGRPGAIPARTADAPYPAA